MEDRFVSVNVVSSGHFKQVRATFEEKAAPARTRKREIFEPEQETQRCLDS